MKKFYYFIIPIALLLIFIFMPKVGKFGGYLASVNDIKAAEQTRLVEEQKKAEERQRKEVEQRQKAWDEAKAQAEQRIKEYNLRQEKEKRQNEEKTYLTEQRNIAFQEKNTLLGQVKQLTDDLRLAKEQKNKIEEQLKIQKTQVDYLKTAVKDVAQNRTTFENALNKLQAAENAFAEAERQRAQTAANTIKR